MGGREGGSRGRSIYFERGGSRYVGKVTTQPLGRSDVENACRKRMCLSSMKHGRSTTQFTVQPINTWGREGGKDGGRGRERGREQGREGEGGRRCIHEMLQLANPQMKQLCARFHCEKSHVIMCFIVPYDNVTSWKINNYNSLCRNALVTPLELDYNI